MPEYNPIDIARSFQNPNRYISQRKRADSTADDIIDDFDDFLNDDFEAYNDRKGFSTEFGKAMRRIGTSYTDDDWTV